MPTIGNNINHVDTLCERCHSKKKMAKQWTEKIENSAGFMTLVHKQMVCTNKECQAEFDKNLAAEAAKREKIKLAKQKTATK